MTDSLPPELKQDGFLSVDPEEQKEFEKLPVIKAFAERARPMGVGVDELSKYFDFSNTGIQLPTIVHFRSHELTRVPDKDGLLWGILMKYEVKRKETKARHEGVIFIPNDQRKKTKEGMERLSVMSGHTQMWEWALNSDIDHVPFALRFDSLAGPLKRICGPDGPHPVRGPNARGYLQPTKCWYLPTVGMTLEQIYNKNMRISNYWEELPRGEMPISINKGTTRRPKRKFGETRQKLVLK